jgi:hypothetical protein
LTKLHFGVLDIPYTEAPEKGSKKAASGTQTTGDVATWLEDKYHVLEIFYNQHQEEIVGALENGLAGSLENMMLGAPVNANIFGTAESEITTLFRKFIESKEMDHLGYPGVPTKASLKGVNHRLKLKKGPVRPSFRDTGLYEASMRAWVEHDLN